MADFDLCGALRRIRRIADLSQRGLASATGLSAGTLASAEAGTRDLRVRDLARAAAVAGLRLALLDDEGREVDGMDDDAVRDMIGRRFPAHLDTRYGDDRWWHGDERYSRPRPWYTFDRDRERRDARRERDGTPDDHQPPQPGDSPTERKAARQREAQLRADEKARELCEEQVRRRVEAGLSPWEDPDPVCECPDGCDPLTEKWCDVHVPDCPCRCDVC